MKLLFIIESSEIQRYNQIINSPRHMTSSGLVFGGKRSHTYVKSVLIDNNIKHTEVSL